MTGLRSIGTLAVVLLALTIVRADEGVKLRALPPVYYDDAGLGLKAPEGVACDRSSLLAVADTGNGRLLTFKVTGEVVTPVRIIRVREAPYPIGVQFDANGDLVALDGRQRRIVRFAPSGQFKEYVEIAGDDAATPIVPRSFRIDASDNLYLLDVGNARVLVLDSGGQIQRRITLPGESGSYADLAVDSHGSVFVLETVAKRLFVARTDDAEFVPLTESMREDMAFPTSIAVDHLGRLFIADENGGGIVILGPDGSFQGRQSSMGWKSGSLRYPSGLCVDSAGMMFVADRGNNRIQVFAVTVTE
jgi:sugar lactone lactonase YvrE